MKPTQFDINSPLFSRQSTCLILFQSQLLWLRKMKWSFLKFISFVVKWCKMIFDGRRQKAKDDESNNIAQVASSPLTDGWKLLITFHTYKCTNSLTCFLSWDMCSETSEFSPAAKLNLISVWRYRYEMSNCLFEAAFEKVTFFFFSEATQNVQLTDMSVPPT